MTETDEDEYIPVRVVKISDLLVVAPPETWTQLEEADFEDDQDGG